jgi:multidrug resistance protein, MATE family
VNTDFSDTTLLANHRTHSYASHYRTLVGLAVPVMFTQAGHMIVQITDNIFVGRLGATSLAASSFAHNVFIGGLLFGVGFGAAMTPLVGAAKGMVHNASAGAEAGAQEGAAASVDASLDASIRAVASWLRNGAVANMLLGCVLVALMLVLGLFLDDMGQDPEVVRLARPVYFLWVLSIAPAMMFVTLKQFAEGIGNTRAAAIITVQEIILNTGANYILIYGKLGLPALGVVGSGWATLLARLSMPATFVVLFYTMPSLRLYVDALAATRFDAQKLKRYIALGVPLAGQTILEVAAFALGAIMMGWLGARELASHQIAIGLAALTFMGATGIAAAATIKVAQYRGAGERENMRRSGFASMHIVLVYMLCTALAFVALRQWLPTLYVSDHAVQAMAANLLLLAALFQIFDGLQVVSLGSLRGLADATVPTTIAFASYVIIALPVSYCAAFVLGWREMGIWTGYVSGLCVASGLFAVRFWLRSKTLVLSS